MELLANELIKELLAVNHSTCLALDYKEVAVAGNTQKKHFVIN